MNVNPDCEPLTNYVVARNMGLDNSLAGRVCEVLMSPDRKRKVAFMMPPQFGKTSLACIYTAWRTKLNPGIAVGFVSYSSLATSHALKKIGKLQGEFGVDGESAVDGLPCGGGCGGMPFDLVVVDSVFKTRSEALDPSIQKQRYDWFMDIVQTRVLADSEIVIFDTRWHPGDLIGRIAASDDAGNWDFVKLPALVDNESTNARYPASHLLKTKDMIGDDLFDTLYQQQVADFVA